MEMCLSPFLSQTVSSKSVFWPQHFFTQDALSCTIPNQRWHQDPVQDRWTCFLPASSEGQHQSAWSTMVLDFLFSDDCALAAHSEDDLQCLADCFSHFESLWANDQYQEDWDVALGSPLYHQAISKHQDEGFPMRNVEDFTYLGSCLSSSGSLDKEIYHLAKASSSFGRLWTRVWHHTENKSCCYRAVVLTSLLYRFETWTCYHHHIRKLDQFHHLCLHRLLDIHWEDRMTNQ